MKLTEQLINAIEDKIGIIIPRDGWDPEFDAVLEKIKGVEEDSDFLDCLNAAGVDNWGGYAEAQEMYDNE